MNNIIEAENLVFKYEDEEETLPERIPPALSGVTINIKRGSFTAIIGHNGSGKSTLAKLLSGVFLPASGSVRIYPQNSEKVLCCSKEEDNFEIRKTVGMVFQNPDNQLVSTIVEDDVAFAPENLGVEPEEIRRRVDDALKTVGLSEYAGHDTHKLSGGQKQRVAIAGILAMNPECIIFDESTAMLDPKGREDILNTILELKKRGITAVLITHYMNEAAMADEVFVINEGTLLTSGTPKEVFSQRKLLLEAGLEPPQAKSLLYELKKAGLEVDDSAINETEAAEAIAALLIKKQVNKQNA